MQEQQQQQALAILQRKLAALGYGASFDVGSAALVQKLLGDLVLTTESYRDLKQQAALQLRETTNLNDRVWTFQYSSQPGRNSTHHIVGGDKFYDCSQVAVLMRDLSRLAKENNELHLELIGLKETAERRTLEHQQQLRSFEEQVAFPGTVQPRC